MKGLWAVLSILTVLSVLVFAPGVGTAQTDQMSGGQAPIAQPLVREGDFAVRLAVALNLGSVAGEVEAESTLSASGISPRNGWIADYPVTPDIAAELRTAVVAASGNGSVTPSKDQALTAFDALMSEYDLALRADVNGRAADSGAVENYPDSQAVNSYYSDEGPPVITYYAPPYDYAYLYTWVPYPFWWWDFWFPGFFVLADFDRDDFGHRHHDRDHHRDGSHFSNHFFDQRSNAVSRVDPSHRPDSRSFVARGTTRGAGTGRSVWTGSAGEVRNPLVSPWDRGSVTPSFGHGTVSPSKSSPVFRGNRGDRSDYRTGNTFSQGIAGNFTNSSSAGAPGRQALRSTANGAPHFSGSWSPGRVDRGVMSHPLVNRSFNSFGGRQWR